MENDNQRIPEKVPNYAIQTSHPIVSHLFVGCKIKSFTDMLSIS